MNNRWNTIKQPQSLFRNNCREY